MTDHRPFAKQQVRAATHAVHDALEAVSLLDDREAVGYLLEALNDLYACQGRLVDLKPAPVVLPGELQ